MKILLLKGFFLKTSWCFQNFLMMEFYRKICNKCYWSNIYNSKHCKAKKLLILAVSFISVLFFSFFYLPTDPANTNKSSYFIRLKDFIANFKLRLQRILNNISIMARFLTSSFINLLQLSFIQRDIITLKSSLLI
ncbi:MAG: hypothetical protein M3R36_05825 [Bacteroidota bacterium]|nr:hypothetical protein [Bacteroidota bacterium]